MLTSSLEKEIERFGRTLKWISRFEPLFVFLPIDKVQVNVHLSFRLRSCVKKSSGGTEAVPLSTP
jgi:hypothetical protein